MPEAPPFGIVSAIAADPSRGCSHRESAKQGVTNRKATCASVSETDAQPSEAKLQEGF